MVRSRIRWTLVVALAAHAGVYAWVRHIPPTTSALSSSEAPPTEIDVSVELAETPPETPAPPDRDPDRVRGEQAKAPTGVRAPGTPATPSTARGAGDVGGVGGVGDVATSSDPSPPHGDGWTFSPVRPGNPSAGNGTDTSANAFAQATRDGVNAVVAQAAKEDEARARKRGIPGFTLHDIELGLVPGSHLGPLASDRVRRSNTPDVGFAVLEFRTDSAGIVASVRVVQASSGHADWNAVATDLVDDARSRPPLHVPSGARGLVVTVNVTSAMRTVSGASPDGSTISKVTRAITNPLDTIVDSRTTARRIVAARVVSVTPL